MNQDYEEWIRAREETDRARRNLPAQPANNAPYNYTYVTRYDARYAAQQQLPPHLQPHPPVGSVIGNADWWPWGGPRDAPPYGAYAFGYAAPADQLNYGYYGNPNCYVQFANVNTPAPTFPFGAGPQPPYYGPQGCPPGPAPGPTTARVSAPAVPPPGPIPAPVPVVPVPVAQNPPIPTGPANPLRDPRDRAFLGRTQREVREDHERIAVREGAYNNHDIVPRDATPDQQFWVVQRDGSRVLRPYATIANGGWAGSWRKDGVYGHLYFVRN